MNYLEYNKIKDEVIEKLNGKKTQSHCFKERNDEKCLY